MLKENGQKVLNSFIRKYCLMYAHKLCARVHVVNSRADSEGVGPPLPPKNHKSIGFLSNIGPDPLEITKLPSRHRHARKCHLNGVSLAGR